MYKTVLLTILTLSVFTIAIVELTGISKTSFMSREHTKTRCEIMAAMPKTDMQFYETKFSFGMVSAGRVLTHTFRYKNAGTNPLMICRTDVSCGCTVPHFSEEPLAAGADGEIMVEFNTAGKSGFQQKNILVHSNSLREAMSITIEADVR